MFFRQVGPAIMMDLLLLRTRPKRERFPIPLIHFEAVSMLVARTMISSAKANNFFADSIGRRSSTYVRQ